MRQLRTAAATAILLAAAMQGISAQEPMRFDFGLPQAAPGWTPVTAATLYSESLGYGFEPGAVISSVENRKGTELTKDYVTSTDPFSFSVRLPQGNYRVRVTLGDTKGTSRTTIRSEIRRLMVESAETAKKQISTVEFNVNVRDTLLSQDNHLKLNTSELDYQTGKLKKITWDDKLTLQFYDSAPKVCGLEIEPAPEDVVTVFVIGDSTVTDQASGGTWAQYLPRWFNTGVAVSNHAESGQTIKGFRFSRRWDKVLEMAKPGDYLFIQLGTNDEKSRGHDPMWPEGDQGGDWIRTHSDASTDYVWELATMAVEAKRHGVIPVIVSAMTKINRQNYTPTELMTPYGLNAPRAAELADCAFIDLWGMSCDIVRAIGEDSLKAYADGTHTDNYGAYLFSLCIVKGIRENGLDLARFIREDAIEIDPTHPRPTLGEFTVPIEPKPQQPQPVQRQMPAGWTPMGPL